MQFSYWEQDAMASAHCIVVGAGLVGLQTALSLRTHLPGQRILVLERGMLPAGASTRNAGFACFGSLTEILADIDSIGASAALDLIDQRWRGISLLRKLIGDEAMEYESMGGHELIRAAEQPALERLDEANRLLHPLVGKAVFALNESAFATAGFGPDVLAMVSNPLEGQLHSGKAMQALRRTAVQNDIEIINGAEVVGLEEGASGVDVWLAGGTCMRAQRVAVCTNALIPSLLPSLPVVPGRGQVLVTDPLPGLPFRGCFHIEQGYYYFRNVGERVLLGGGRNLDFTAEATTEMAVSAKVQDALERMLADTILPGRPYRIASRWAGIMGFTANKQPLVERSGQRVVAGFGCNGMGVALSPLIATQTARLLLEG
ncbi:NAD(P)/FAD-dependent oxidoreductase [Lacisediminimonas profundi]|uniref:NAD(P)/FAD-dependent oxidoreductase n=1 Tax=Lacisediminimonas profundi TaxID=2603856 RepID=UPI0019D5CA67|nr:FAD-dependent oxidoreductase [Lacisediminimonas profundi]